MLLLKTTPQTRLTYFDFRHLIASPPVRNLARLSTPNCICVDLVMMRTLPGRLIYTLERINLRELGVGGARVFMFKSEQPPNRIRVSGNANCSTSFDVRYRIAMKIL